MDERNGEGNKGLRHVLGQGCAAAALAAVAANGSSRVIVPVLAEAGSLEMQQLLLHQEDEQLDGSPSAAKDSCQQPGSDGVGLAPAGQQPQHQQQQPLLHNENSSGSSRGCVARLQHPGSPDCQAALPAASISAAGTRHRAGHGPKQRGSYGSGSNGSYGSGSGSSGDSSSSSSTPTAFIRFNPGAGPPHQDSGGADKSPNKTNSSSSDKRGSSSKLSSTDVDGQGEGEEVVADSPAVDDPAD